MKNDPTNLPEDPDPLAALLREADEYVPDHGFTARVVKNLPARRQRGWLRFVLLSVALLLGAGLGAWQYPALAEMFNGASARPLVMSWQTLLALVLLLAVVASLVWTMFALASDED